MDSNLFYRSHCLGVERIIGVFWNEAAMRMDGRDATLACHIGRQLQGVDPGAATVDVDAVAVVVEVSGSRASATGVGER